MNEKLLITLSKIKELKIYPDSKNFSGMGWSWWIRGDDKWKWGTQESKGLRSDLNIPIRDWNEKGNGTLKYIDATFDL
jgi:hypothetical protein